MAKKPGVLREDRVMTEDEQDAFKNGVRLGLSLEEDRIITILQDELYPMAQNIENETDYQRGIRTCLERMIQKIKEDD
jgi:hypothetical protein